MKRFSFIAMLFGFIGSIYADTATINGYTWTYESYGSSSTLVSVSPEPTGRLVLPDELGGKDVTVIKDHAFNGLWQVNEIVFPKKLRSIGWDAFKGCTGLKELILPNTITEIGSSSFDYCTGLTNVVISSGMSYIDYCFNECTSLENVAIPQSIKNIDGFTYCTSLKSIVIPDSVYRIGAYAFEYCTSLRYLVIGHAVTSIEYRAFYGCTMLWNVVNYSPLTLTKGEDGVACYARDIYSEIPDGWGEILPLYSVSFDANGGTGTMGDFQLEIGRLQRLPANAFTRNYYSFKGWSTTHDGNVEFEDSEEVLNLATEDGTTVYLYAVWEGDQYNVYFSDNGGDGYMMPQVVEYRKPTTLVSNEFYRTGYKFVGWSTSSYANYANYADGSEFDLRYPQDTTLYAIWLPNTCTVTYDLQGGSGFVSNSTFTYGESNYAPYYSGSKMGYEFVGWALAPDGEVVLGNHGYDTNGIMSDFLVEDGGEVTLYAVWRGVKCWILFSGNGGSGSMPSLWPDPRYDETITLPTNTYTRAGYSFLGWSVSWPTMSVDFTAGQTVSVSNIVLAYYGSNYMPSSPTVWLDAVWKNEIETPTISPADGVYKNASCEISLSCETDGVAIYYTTDGNSPKIDGKLYTSPFIIWQTATIKAVARREDGFWSEIAIRTVEREEALSEAANFYGYTMETDDSHPWTVVTDVSHDGVSSVQSGTIGNNEATWLQSSIKKAGKVSFWWRAACEEADEEEGDDGYYDYGAFLVDDVVVARIAGHDGEWHYVSREITGGGKHTLKWEYRKDGATSYQPDCIWVDQVQWIPADDSGYTLTTPEHVPYSWLKKYGFDGVEVDYEAAANVLSGKTQGGKATKLWEEFVAGTDPTNETSVLTARIDVQDGVPVVTWEPNLNTNSIERLYKVYGKETLSPTEKWAYPTNSLHRFFKVTVEMP